MKRLELKAVNGTINSFTSAVRDQVLQTFQVLRQSDDAFAQGLYDTTRRAFVRNLRDALDAKDAACSDKVRSALVYSLHKCSRSCTYCQMNTATVACAQIKRLAAQHEQTLATQRAAAAVAQKQAVAAARTELDQELRAENKALLAQAIQGLSAAYAQQANLPRLALGSTSGSVQGPTDGAAARGGTPGDANVGNAWQGQATGSHVDAAGQTSPGATPQAHQARTHSPIAPGMDTTPIMVSTSLMELLQTLTQDPDEQCGPVVVRFTRFCVVHTAVWAVQHVEQTSGHKSDKPTC